MTPDHELIRMTLHGDRTSAKRLIERYYPRVLFFLRRMLHEETLAEDISQETFLRVHEKLSQFETTRPFQPWLLKVAYHEALRYLRRKSVTLAKVDLGEVPSRSGKDRPDRIEDRLILEDAISWLPLEQRLTLPLKITLDLTYEEIAEYAYPVDSGSNHGFQGNMLSLACQAHQGLK